MALFNKKKVETRNADTGSLLEFINGGVPSVPVNEENVLQISGVKNSVDLISRTIGMLPVQLYKEQDGKITKIEKDDRLFLLNNEPNPFEQSNNFKRKLVKDLLLYGKSYALLDKKGLKINSLHYIASKQCSVTDIVNSKGMIIDKKYNFTLNNRSKEDEFYNMLEVSYGKGILKENDKILKTLLYINDYESYIFENATLPSGILETEGRVTEDLGRNLRKQIEKLYSGARNFFRPMILEQGLKWKNITQNPNDLMLDKAKDNAVKEVERIFNLPYGFLNNIANTNPTDQNLLFLQRTITPITVAIEESLNQSLLLESEKQKGYFFRLDVGELMKMTPDKTVQYVSNAIEKGIFTINEGRQMLNLEPFANGDSLLLSLGGVMMDETGKIQVFNTGKGMNGENDAVTDEVKQEDNKEQTIKEDIQRA